MVDKCWGKCLEKAKSILLGLAILELIFSIGFFLLYSVVRLVDVNAYLGTGSPRFGVFNGSDHAMSRKECHSLQIYCGSSIFLSFVFMGQCGMLILAIHKLKKLALEFWFASSLLGYTVYFIVLAIFYYKVPLWLPLVVALFAILKIFQFVLVGFHIEKVRLEYREKHPPPREKGTLVNLATELALEAAAADVEVQAGEAEEEELLANHEEEEAELGGPPQRSREVKEPLDSFEEEALGHRKHGSKLEFE